MTRLTVRQGFWPATVLLGLVLLAATSWPTATTAATTNTAEILAKTSAALPQCLRWRLTGICLWLRCGFRGCRIRVSPRVFNYAPDAVVTTHNAAAQHPWVELRPVLAAANAGLAGLVGGFADASGSVEGRREQGNPVRGRDHQTFREADLVGHPFSASGLVLGAAGLVCPPRTVPLMPYFVSTLDALAWREIVPIESLYPASLIPGLKEIGNWPVNTWGNVYPRTGMALQQEEPKAAAILAQRVGDITTRSAQPHVYVPLSQAQLSWGMRYWNPPALEPNDERTGSWQMLEPRADTSCYAFGRNDALGLSSWSDGRRDPGGDYQFNLWRPYSCCRRLGTFLRAIP
jgi:integrating conjugative element protein (TIGR03756 family)